MFKRARHLIADTVLSALVGLCILTGLLVSIVMPLAAAKYLFTD